MKVELLTYTMNPESTAYSAYRACVGDVSNSKKNINEIKSYLDNRILKDGHLSALRQIHFVFRVIGISRACLDQLVRHKVGVDVQVTSQRYCEVTEYVVPEMKDKELQDKVQRHLEESIKLYRELLLSEKKEDARAVLPMAACTNVQASFSFEALMNFYSQRACSKAQSEIRTIAKEMKRVVEQVSPVLSRYLMSCSKCGKCKGTE